MYVELNCGVKKYFVLLLKLNFCRSSRPKKHLLLKQGSMFLDFSKKLESSLNLYFRKVSLSLLYWLSKGCYHLERIGFI